MSYAVRRTFPSVGVGGADYAEMMLPGSGAEPGEALAMGADGRLVLATAPFQFSVASVDSTRPVFRRRPTDRRQLGRCGPTGHPRTGAGEGDSGRAAIRPGEVLVTSSTSGHAMHAGPNPPEGAVIGKAFGRLNAGLGVTEMLATLQ